MIATLSNNYLTFNKLIFSSILLFFVFYSVSKAQTVKGTISGFVTDTSGKPLEEVSVVLKATSKGDYTDSKGEFIISNVEEGSYTLVVHLLGYHMVESRVEVKATEKTIVPAIRLMENPLILDSVPIEVNRNKFAKKESIYAAKMPLTEIENPQVTNIVSSEVLKDQVVTNFDDALKNVPGMDKRWESTGRSGDGAGYYSLRGFNVQPTLINGLPGLTNGSLDPANIERIEVIKGPSGTLFGSSLISYGGLINIVTKRPYHYFGGEIIYNSGSFGLNRITADINTPLSKEKKIALRTNAAYHTENSFQDAGFKKSFFLSPSFSYEVNDRLSFFVNTEFLQSEGTNPTMIFLNRSSPLVAKNLDELNYNNRLSYTSNDVTIKNPAYSMQAQMKYQLSKQWVSQTVFSRGTAKSDGYYSYLWDFADGNSTYGRYISKQNSTTLNTDLQQNFIGDFKLGKLRNRVVAGLDYFSKIVQANNSGYVLYDQVTIQDEDPSQLSRTSLDTALAKAGISKTKTTQEVYSSYVSDVLNITPKLGVMASLRLDYFNNKGVYDATKDTTTGIYKQTTLSPKFGLTYQLIQNKLVLFTNYLNGFKNTAPVLAGSKTFTFNPEHANQWEAGIKADLIEGKVTGSISYYNIQISGIVMSVGDVSNPDYNQNGSTYSRGFETSIIAAPFQGFNIIAGYSYNESKIVNTDNKNFEGRRPEGAGPQHMINGWMSYRLHKGLLNRFGLGFGANYSSEYATLNRASTGTFTLPAYLIVNSSVFYDAYSYRLTLKVNNLTNVEYYSGWSTINPQKPRNVVASFAYKF